jgi:hypothetical protein
MEIYEGRTHVGELMWENGDIWGDMERFGGMWGDMGVLGYTRVR